MSHDHDEVMDRLLSDVLAGDVPALPSAFDARVLRRVGPRRLRPAGRILMAVYTVAATAVAAWVMRDFSPAMIGAAAALALPAAAVAAAYGRLAAAER